jgi:hypothetical protein
LVLLDMGFSGDDESAAGADSVLTVGRYLLASDGFFEAGVDQLVDDLIDIHPAHKFFGDQNRRGGLGGDVLAVSCGLLRSVRDSCSLATSSGSPDSVASSFASSSGFFTAHFPRLFVRLEHGVDGVWMLLGITVE